jgi:glycerophosphoryl diester phosphodiesterase
MIELRREPGRPLRIGHRGAAALAPENTIASLERAVAHGVDVVEIDVLDTHDGELVLAHADDLHEVSHGLARGRVRPLTLDRLRRVAPALPTLDEALAFLAERAPDTGLQLDLKARGFEQHVVRALRRHDLLRRTFVSSFHRQSLAVLRSLEPALPRGLTYPEDRYGVARRRAMRPMVAAAAAAVRRVLPYRLEGWLARTEAAAAALHWAVLSRAAIERCHARGAAAIAWTVDDPHVADRLIQAGIDGIVTNDPRIFQGLLTT